MRKSLRMQILIPFMVLIIAASGIITYLGYYFATRMTVENQTAGNETAMKLLNGNLSLYLKEHERLAEMLAGNNELEQAAQYGLDSKQGKAVLPAVRNIFQEALKADDQLTNVYVGLGDKGMLVEPAADLPDGFDPTSREWYKKAAAQKSTTVWVEPYIDTATKTLVLTVSRAVVADGKLVGVVGADLKIDSILGLINSVKLGDTGHVFMLDAQNRIISHRDNGQIGSDQSGSEFVKQMQEKGAAGTVQYKSDGTHNILSYVTNDKTGWKIAGVANLREFEDKAAGLLTPSLISLLAVMMVAGLLSWPLTQAIIRPIRRLQAAMLEFRQGNLSVRSGIRKRNEIGQLADGFDEMAGQMGTLMDHIRQTSGQLAESSHILKLSAAENTASSSEVAVTMQEMASGAGDQAEIVEHNAVVVQEMARHIDSVEQETGTMQGLTQSMMEVAAVNGERLEQLSVQTRNTVEAAASVKDAMYSLGESSRQIGEFVSVIAGITAQTNILSLNAAIEAARAGEQGRGFGVVAAEIRKLAAHSEEALASISELVERMGRNTREAVQMTEKAGESMSKQAVVVRETRSGFVSIQETVQANLEGIARVIAAVGALTTEKNKISTNTSELQAICQATAAGTEEVSASVQEQTASMEQLNHLARQLEDVAQTLSREISKFKS
jgi:methyl-accepting chemotaxis protein